MVFASPIWLLALLPWAAMVIYLLPGRGTPAVVPFVKLWKGSVTVSRWRGRRWPSMAVLSMLLALLLAVLAAAKPGLPAVGGDGGVGGVEGMGGDVSIVIDRGASMAAPSPSGLPLRGVVQECARRLGALAGGSHATIVPVPGASVQLDGDNWLPVAEEIGATVLPVRLDQVVADQLRQSAGPVVVLSDQNLHQTDRRIVQVPPQKVADGMAITAMSARSLPRAEVMIRIVNRSDRKTVHLFVTSGKHFAEREVILPGRGQSIDQFVDLDGLDSTVSAQLTPHAANDPWSMAFAAREGSGVRIAVDPAMDAAIKRIAEVFAKDRPGAPDAPLVVIANHSIASEQPGIWVDSAPLAGAATATRLVVPNTLTRNITAWPPAGAGEMPDGFSALVSSATGKVIVAARQQPSRQLWLNADLSNWEKTPDFVIFFANAFQWLSEDEHYTPTAPVELGADWRKIDGDPSPPGLNAGEWPGLYLSPSTGRILAVNAGTYPSVDQATPSTQWSQRQGHSLSGGLFLQSAAIFAALASLLAAMLLWASPYAAR